MAATFQCPKCSQRYALKENLIGKTVKCHKCGEKFQVPVPPKPAAQPATAAPAPAKPIAPATAAPAGLPPLPPLPASPVPSPGAAGEASSLPPLSSGLDDLLDGIPAAPAAPAPLPAASPLAPVGPAKKRSAPARKKASGDFWSLGEMSDKDKQRLWAGLGIVGVALLGFFLPVHRFLGRRGRFIPTSAYPVLSVILTIVGLGMVLWSLRRRLAIALPGAGGVLVLMVVFYIISPYRAPDDADVGATGPAAQAASTISVPPAGSPGATPQDLAGLQRDAVASINRLADLLNTVQDPQSARNAIPEVRTTIDRLNVAQKKIAALEEKGVELSDKDEQQLGQQMMEAGMKFAGQVLRIHQNPAFQELAKELDRYNPDGEE